VRKGPSLLWLSLLLALAAGCSGAPASGPIEPKWDRTVCEQCQMVISNRRYAAQAREVPGGRPHQFDDLGCALLWLEASGLLGRSQAEGQSLELWVRDSEGAGWVDGWEARYESGLHSPMGYGFAAAREGGWGGLPIEAVRERVIEQEAIRRASGG
jgi:hypothetical protein